MIAVADASPHYYLVLIGEIDLLPKLFLQVEVPQAVIAELLDEGAPEVVRNWASDLPAWISTAATTDVVSGGLEKLQAGERAAIILPSPSKPTSSSSTKRQRAVSLRNADSTSLASLACSAKPRREDLWTLRPPSTASAKRASDALPRF